MAKTKAPKKGWRLAWRQNYGNRSGLSHRHSTTIFPEGDRDMLERISASVNVGYRLQDYTLTFRHTSIHVPGGRHGIIQWVERYDEEADVTCPNYWGISEKRKRKEVA